MVGSDPAKASLALPFLRLQQIGRLPAALKSSEKGAGKIPHSVVKEAVVAL